MSWIRSGLAAAALAGAAALLCGAAPAKPSAAACAASGRISFVCGPANAEDVVVVPGGRYLISSGMSADGGVGALYLVDARKRLAVLLALDVSGKALAPYGACPSRPDLKRFASHGLALRPGSAGRHELYVVNHGGRESVEVFSVDASGRAPRLRWIGCLVMPEGATPNSVAPLPDGGLVVSKFQQAGDAKAFEKMAAGEATGLLYTWRPKAGFKTVPGSALSGDNGVEVSPDGKWIFVNAWPERRIVRLAPDGWTMPAEARVDFLPDNLHWAPDGQLLVTGQVTDVKAILACDKPHCPHDWAVARLDPATMKVTPLVREKGTEVFSDATGAVQLGKELWVGTYRGDRIAIVPLD